MKKEEILALTAGDELDKIISREIFHIIETQYEGSPIKAPAYSVDLTSTWRVLEFLIESCRGNVTIYCLPKPYLNGDVWEVTARDISLRGNKLGEVICKVALLKYYNLK